MRQVTGTDDYEYDELAVKSVAVFAVDATGSDRQGALNPTGSPKGAKRMKKKLRGAGPGADPDRGGGAACAGRRRSTDELNAYWEKADPLYAQIEALGTRQAEIYQQFGLSLDDDTRSRSPWTTPQYEQYVKGLGVLTDAELKTLMDTNAEIVKLSDEIDELTARHDASDDPTEQGVLDNLIPLQAAPDRRG